jgi:hypothetical protein
MPSDFPLRKLSARSGDTVEYTLATADGPLALAPFIGAHFGLRATGRLTCTGCGRDVKKFYGQGFCFPCFRDAPEASECIVRPELCRAHLGEGRNVDWEVAHHATEHVVYLSRTAGLKVGVTRSTQIPVRWIDQGAVAALAVARTPYRQLAGLIEVDLKRSMADRTNWQAMLRQVEPEPDALLQLRNELPGLLREDLHTYLLPDAMPEVLRYPVLHYPAKVVSMQLAKEPLVEGRLIGIKGQYLMWEDGRVLNVRNHSGYHVTLV